jgi:hypothetical protein
MELIGCNGNIISGTSTNGYILECSVPFQSVVVPDNFPDQEIDIVSAGAFFAAGLTLAGVFMIAGSVLRSILNFIKW